MTLPEEDYSTAIQQCRTLLGGSARKLSFFAMRRLKMKPPAWMKDSSDTRFQVIFDNQVALLKRGRVVLSALVQANSLLFEDGDQDHPAVVIYSLDPRADCESYSLGRAAQDLFSIKGEDMEDPELAAFSAKLADEMVMDLKLPIPLALTDGIPCFYTCIMVARAHLPNGRLGSGLIPLLVCPDETEATMILPGQYWPEDLKNDLDDD